MSAVHDFHSAFFSPHCHIVCPCNYPKALCFSILPTNTYECIFKYFETYFVLANTFMIQLHIFIIILDISKYVQIYFEYVRTCLEICLNIFTNIFYCICQSKMFTPHWQFHASKDFRWCNVTSILLVLFWSCMTFL